MQQFYKTMVQAIFRWGLPLIFAGLLRIEPGWGSSSTFAQGPAYTRRVNIPFFDNTVILSQRAILWFGQVDNTYNYADARLGYNQNELVVTLHIFDRRLWYDQSPAAADLTDWDAVTLYLHLDGNSGNVPTANSYRFVAQANHWQPQANYQRVDRGNGSGWTSASIPFTTVTGWRSPNGFNNDEDDRGWTVTFEIPFASLGLSEAPPTNSLWGLALTLHDRDDAAGTSIPTQSWPESVDIQQPATWGQLVFGQSGYVPPLAGSGNISTVRHGLNGAIVEDAHVGGDANCGDAFAPDYFDDWGAANYAGDDQINIQNQADVADWPCFSKFYITFPLDSLPPNQVIISATLTMHLFGNSNPDEAAPSLIQAFTIAESWDESTVTWNNAPLATENVAATWVNPVDQFPGWPGVPAQWNVSGAVAEAYNAGTPLRLALYAADGAYHSGKHFSSSDVEDWNAAGRPTLEIRWGEPLQVVDRVYLPLIVK